MVISLCSWRVVKAFGFKGAVGVSRFMSAQLSHTSSQPKITIALLDEEELRPLAHLMNSYPSVLKEKAQIVQTRLNTK